MSTAPSRAADLVVLISGGFRSTYQDVLPEFEKKAGIKATTVPSPSMGETPEAIPNRLARGEAADVLVMVEASLDELIDRGLARPDTKVELALSPIGMAVRGGVPLPDISTPDKLRSVLLGSDSVAYSDSASGNYVSGKLFEKLGIADTMKNKARRIPGTPVAEIVARGQADIGFQEVAEILPVKGASFAGKLPVSLELLTPYAAAVATSSRHPAEAGQRGRFLASSAVVPTLEKDGLEPPHR